MDKVEKAIEIVKTYLILKNDVEEEALRTVIEAAGSYDDIYKDLFEAVGYVFKLNDEMIKCKDTLTLLCSKLGRLVVTHPNDIPKPPPDTALAPKRFETEKGGKE